MVADVVHGMRTLEPPMLSSDQLRICTDISSLRHQFQRYGVLRQGPVTLVPLYHASARCKSETIVAEDREIAADGLIKERQMLPPAHADRAIPGPATNSD